MTPTLAPTAVPRQIDGTFLARCADAVFRDRGYVLLDLAPCELTDAAAAAAARELAALIARPVAIELGAPVLWSPLGVDLAAHPARAHGTGMSPLHVDLMTWTHVPRAIALYCVRPDPAGGGASELADLCRACHELDTETRTALARPVFSYWRDTGVDLLGAALAWFAVVPERPGAQPVRYTRKLLDRIASCPGAIDPALAPAAIVALERFHAALVAHAHRTTLRRQQLLIFDQHRFAHARLPLGAGQERIPEAERRLLLQCYLTPRA